jgi:hypothetical protein
MVNQHCFHESSPSSIQQPAFISVIIIARSTDWPQPHQDPLAARLSSPSILTAANDERIEKSRTPALNPLRLQRTEAICVTGRL